MSQTFLRCNFGPFNEPVDLIGGEIKAHLLENGDYAVSMTKVFYMLNFRTEELTRLPHRAETSREAGVYTRDELQALVDFLPGFFQGVEQVKTLLQEQKKPEMPPPTKKHYCCCIL